LLIAWSGSFRSYWPGKDTERVFCLLLSRRNPTREEPWMTTEATAPGVE
jgi:hypothetical protein